MKRTLARWLKPKIGEATKFTEHEKELIKQAYEHPIEQRPKGRMITEFRKGRWVKSISPEDLQKIFEDYLEEYPEDRVVKTKVCYEE